MTISESSFLRFSPDKNLAYSAKNRLFWLIAGRGTAVDAWAEGTVLAFPFPFGDIDGPSDLVLRTLVRSASGRKTAAQRSYSRQSKKDFAKRYLLSSFASSAASSGSLFWEYIGDLGCCSSVGCSSSLGSGSDVRSSAAL
jgi:hypothetical protein